MDRLPPTSCPLGYTDADLDVILGDRRPEFNRWMSGQTMTLCNGHLYHHGNQRDEPSVCATDPHGPVVYPVDLVTFLAGRPPLD